MTKDGIFKQFKVDSYNVCQYEDTRFVDVVELIEAADKKYILCYSPKYRANVLIPRSELTALDRAK